MLNTDHERPGTILKRVFFTVVMLALITFPVFRSPAFADQNIPSPVFQPVLEKGVLLIASRRLQDPYFGQSVLLLTQYGETGSSGIIINRPSEMPLQHTFPEFVKMLPMLEHLYIGGPVARNRVSLLIQSLQDISGANEVLQGIYHIDTQDLFRSLELEKLGGKTTRLFSGYAGWSPGQLEAEVKRGDWHIWQASAEIIFSPDPGDLWNDLIDLASAKWVLRQ